MSDLLSIAKNPPDILREVARSLWGKAHNDECPSEHIPTEQNILDYWPHLTEDAMDNANERLTAVLWPLSGNDTIDEEGDGDAEELSKRIAATRETTPPDGVKTAPKYRLPAPAEWLAGEVEGLAEMGVGRPGQIAAVVRKLEERDEGDGWISTSIEYQTLALKEVHRRWVKLGQDAPPHPVAPIVAAWQKRVVAVPPFHPNPEVRLLNFRVEKKINQEEGKRLLSMPIPQPLNELQDGTQLNFDLPNLPNRQGNWLLKLYDRLGGPSMKEGRGAPYELHLFMGAMLHLPIEQRTNDFRRLVFKTEEVIRWLHPKGWSQRARDWANFPKALYRLGRELGWVHIPGVGNVLMIGATVIPQTPEDAKVEFMVRIPKAIAQGGEIDWPRLCQYRRESVVLYRAYLCAADHIYQSARKGQGITRQIGQEILDEFGVPLRKSGGSKKRDWSRLKDNDAAQFVKKMTNGQLTELIGLDPDNKAHRIKTIEAFRQLDKDGVIDLFHEGGPKTGRWQIFAPPKYRDGHAVEQA